jgi:hypothetical protein
MCTQTRVTVLCSNSSCGVTITSYTGALDACGKNVRGPLNEVDQNTDEVCDGVEIEEEEEEGGLCHNCSILERLERASAERHVAAEEEEDDEDDDDLEEVYIPGR